MLMFKIVTITAPKKQYVVAKKWPQLANSSIFKNGAETWYPEFRYFFGAFRFIGRTLRPPDPLSTERNTCEHEAKTIDRRTSTLQPANQRSSSNYSRLPGRYPRLPTDLFRGPFSQWRWKLQC